MGLDLNDLFGQAKAAAQQGMDDVLKTGGNAAIGYLETQAVGVLQADKAQHDQAFNQAATNILNRPTAQGSFGAYFSNALNTPLLQNYGGSVVLVVVAAGIVGYLLLKK